MKALIIAAVLLLPACDTQRFIVQYGTVSASYDMVKPEPKQKSDDSGDFHCCTNQVTADCPSEVCLWWSFK